MPDEFAPDLGGLEADYRIESELQRTRRSRTYLARHLQRNRDVTIQVLGAPRSEHDNSLSLYGSDARTLSVIRHPSVVPVIEARWLDGGTFAVVRPRVRGRLLDEVVAEDGPIIASGVAKVLEQVASAVTWARDNGIVHRRVSGDTLRFQQGSGRALVDLAFSPLGAGGGVPDECDDARMLGQLAFEMLAGRRADAEGPPLAEIRQDLPAGVIRELSALMNCDRRSGPVDPASLIGALHAVPDSSFVARPPRRDVPAASSASADVEPESSRTAETPDGGRASFGTRLIILAAISTIVGASGTLLLRRAPPPPRREPASPIPQATATGEVARPASPKPAVVDTPPAPTIDSTLSKSAQPPLVQPPSPRHEPPSGAPATTFPRPPASRATDSSRSGTPSVSPPVASTVIDACESPDAEDQHNCLATAIERGDRSMTATFERLVGALRRQAKALPMGPDPPTVAQLRLAQHDWLASRDIACRAVGDGPMYAVERAQCYADEADRRAKELQTQLERLG